MFTKNEFGFNSKLRAKKGQKRSGSPIYNFRSTMLCLWQWRQPWGLWGESIRNQQRICYLWATWGGKLLLHTKTGRHRNWRWEYSTNPFSSALHKIQCFGSLWGRVIQNFKHNEFISATAFLYSLRKRNAGKCENYQNRTTFKGSYWAWMFYYITRLHDMDENSKFIFFKKKKCWKM